MTILVTITTQESAHTTLYSIKRTLYQGAYTRPVRAQPLTAYYPRYTPGNYQTITFGSQAQPLIKQEQVTSQSLIRQQQAAPQPVVRQAQASKPELGLTVDTSFGKYVHNNISLVVEFQRWWVLKNIFWAMNQHTPEVKF